MIKQVSFLFSFLLVFAGYSQEYFESNAIVREKINYSKLSENGFGKEIFSMLGYKNNIDIRQISLDAKARIMIRISLDTDNNLSAKISMTGVSLEGNLTLRDFNVDSMLWPSGFNANLTLYNGRHKRDIIAISGSTTGKTLTIDLTDYLSSNIGDVSASISDLQFYYDEIQFQKLQNLTKNIDYYYSYGKLLDDLINENNKHIVTNNQTVEKIFIGKIEINRVDNYISGHNFTTSLNLENFDPIGLLKLNKKLQRLSNRATTLFSQQISSIGHERLNPMDFCSYYCELSSQHLKKAKLLQPADASAYEEFAKIDTNENAKENLRLVTEFYNSTNSIESRRLTQCIFDEFVNIANELSADDNFTDALLILNNSLKIHNWFNAVITPEYYSAVLIALDGVASSYLSVGNVAFRANNIELASIYFNKADDVFDANLNIIADVNLPDSTFNSYLKLQYEIALQYIDAGEFENALVRLDAGTRICTKLNNSSQCTLIETALASAHRGKLNLKLNKLEELIGEGQFPDAYQQFLSATRYLSDNSSYLGSKNSRFDKLSYSLFLEFLQRGEILIDAKQPEMALDNLLNAKSIQQHLSGDLIELDRLIKLAAEPEIIKLIDQGKYHTWANRMFEAENIYDDAARLNEEYFSNNNNKINLAIEELNDQMVSRTCLSHKIKYSDAIKKIHIAVKNKQFNRISVLLNEAELLVVTYPECNISDTEVQELINQYSSVLYFYKQYNNISEKLFNKGYLDVIDQYISLIDYYNYHDLFHYDIYFPSLIAFITNQKLPQLTVVTAIHYLNNDKPDIGFQYVKIFKDQGGLAKSIKGVTIDIAKQFADRDNELQKPVNEALQEYTLGDRWYNNFKIAYLKNRILNNVR
ncbi:MAG: hypothetical protein H8E34_14240 [Bacteroidetes bacterium]|nr:hypothetical protein [Bacteroidota bacterium]